MPASLAVFVCLVFPTIAPAADRQLLQAIRAGYQANRAAPRFGTMRFTYVVASAPDVEAARRGELINPYTGKGFYAYDGTNLRYECLYPLDDEVAARTRTSETTWTSVIDSKRFIANNKLILFDDVFASDDGKSVSHSAGIGSLAAGHFRTLEIPLDLGLTRPRGHYLDTDIDEWEKGAQDWSLMVDEEESRSGESRLVRLAFASAREGLSYWVDLERGAVPVRTTLEIKSPSGEVQMAISTLNDDIRRIEGGAWLPFKRTTFITGGRVKQITLREADFAARPSASTFRLEFPRPVALINGTERVKYEPQTVWELAKLPSPGASRAKKIVVAQPGLSVPAQSGPRPARSWGVLTLASLGVLLLCAAGVRTFRKFGRA